MKKIEDFLNDRLPHAGLLPHSLMHSVAPLVLGLFVACLVTLSCNTSDVLIESFELLLLFDPLFMILSRYSFQYVVFKVRGTPQAKLLSANGDGVDSNSLTSLLVKAVCSTQLSYTPKVKSGTHLLSHAVSSIVPSADWVLTVVFGMGTGVSPNRIGTRILQNLYQRFNSI